MRILNNQSSDAFDFCDSCYSMLTIVSEILPAKEITDFLGIAPTSSRTKGELYEYPSGAEGISQINGWYIESENNVNSKNFEEHLQFVLERIYPIREKLRVLRETGKAEMALYGSWEGEMHCGPTITSAQMKIMGEIGLDLELSFCSYREDSEG